MTESGYPQVGFHPDVWQAFVAPAATPSAVINRLNAEVNENVKSTEVKANLDRLGFDPMIMSPQEFAAFLARRRRSGRPSSRPPIFSRSKEPEAEVAAISPRRPPT
jgi:tripartite-type tricarboxylate transporter receptor subunit TctC